MPVLLLEHFQSPSDSPLHKITGAKARRLVDELKWAVPRGPKVIQITVEKSWATIKQLLSYSFQAIQSADRAAADKRDDARRLLAAQAFPDGAEYGFAPWPAKDQRSQFA